MKRLSLLLAALLALVVCVPAGPVAAADDVKKHVVLIDGSGSMEDPAEGVHLYSSGQLEGLLKTLFAVEGAFASRDLVEVGIFSKTDTVRTSPTWIFKGTAGELRSKWMKVSALGGWTDLKGALDAGTEAVKNHKGPQLLWMLTDNIDQETDETKSTETFYEALAARPDLHRIYVFPVDLGAKNGLVLYAMAKERSARTNAEESKLLDAAVAAINTSPMKAKIADGGFLARPLSEDTLKVEIVGFEPDAAISPNATFDFDPATGAIHLTGFAEQKPIRGKFRLKVSSRFPTLRIVDASVAAELTDMSSGHFVLPKALSQEITPKKVSLAPGQTADYTIDLNVAPPLMVWNPFKEPMGALEDEGTIQAQLRLVVKDVTFEAVQPDKFFKVQRIPAILGNRSQVAIPLSAPVTMHVALPWYRLIQVLLFFALLIGLVAVLYAATLGRRRWIRVWGDHFDLTEPVSLRRSLLVPGFGVIKATAGGGLLFVPDRSLAGERPRPLKGRTGEIRMGDHQSFFYDCKVQKKQQHGGGRKRATGTGLY